MSQHIFFPIPCPSCGNQLTYGGGKRELSCKKCGHKRGLQKDSDQVIEKKLEKAVDFSKFQQGSMGEGAMAYSCNGCSVILAGYGAEAPTMCPMCNSIELESVEMPGKAFTPRNILPFLLPSHRAIKILKRHLRKRRPWMNPPALFKAYQEDRLRPIYIPVYLVDAYVRASWKAKAGFRIPVNTKGSITEKEVWEPVTGYLEHLYENELLLCSSQIDGGLFDQINDFSLRDLVDYSPRYLESFPAEVTDTPGKEAVKAAESSIDDDLFGKAIRRIKGEKSKELKILSEKEALTFRHVLLPVWVASYSYKGHDYQYLINGRTGKVAGDKPLSIIRIITLAGLILLTVVLIVWGFF